MGQAYVYTNSKKTLVFPFMKTTNNPIIFAPVWKNTNTTSYIPAGCRAIIKPDLQVKDASWDTIRKYNYYVNGSNKGGTSYTYKVPMVLPNGSTQLSSAPIQPYAFQINYNQTTNIGWSRLASSAVNNLLEAKSGHRPKATGIIYPTKANDACGIILNLSGSEWGKKNTVTAFFGGIYGQYSKDTTASIVISHADCVTQGMWNGASANLTARRGWDTAPCELRVDYSAINVKTDDWKNNSIFTGAFTENAGKTWTGCHVLGTSGDYRLLLIQTSAQIGSGRIFTPQNAFYSGSVSKLTKPLIHFDNWIGIMA